MRRHAIAGGAIFLDICGGNFGQILENCTMYFLFWVNTLIACICLTGAFNGPPVDATLSSQPRETMVYRDTLCGIAIDSLLHTCAPQSMEDAPRRIVKCIKNTSDGPLVLEEVRANDPNYIAYFPRHPLAPGQVDSLVFHMAPGQRGVFRKWFVLVAADNCRMQGELRYELH